MSTLPINEAQPRPLENLRVIDCTQMLSGPFASQLLGDLGADIIKIERPDIGDITRHIEPHLDEDVTAYFASLNGGKKKRRTGLLTARRSGCPRAVG